VALLLFVGFLGADFSRPLAVPLRPCSATQKEEAIQGVVAVKLTSLVNPILLERLSVSGREPLADEEETLMARAEARCLQLANTAKLSGVRLLVDAEQSYFQPAIDEIGRAHV
jgi:hypothetical protein